MRTSTSVAMFRAGVCTGSTVIALRQPQPEIGLGIRLAFEIVSQQSSNAVVGNAECRTSLGLDGGDATDNGGCHGESDRVLHSGFSYEKS